MLLQRQQCITVLQKETQSIYSILYFHEFLKWFFSFFCSCFYQKGYLQYWFPTSKMLSFEWWQKNVLSIYTMWDKIIPLSRSTLFTFLYIKKTFIFHINFHFLPIRRQLTFKVPARLSMHLFGKWHDSYFQFFFFMF